jgi:signal peptidase I
MASESDAPAAAAPEAKEPEKETIWSFLRFLLILFAATILVRSLLIAPFYIPSGSMQPSMMVGDYLFISKWPYGYSRYSFPFGVVNFDGRVMESLPDRGDIAVFRYPGGRNEDFVKRVIGLPGDTIEVRGGQIILNGQPVQRERIDDWIMPVSENSSCRPFGSNVRLVTQEDGSQACAFTRYRETLPGGRSFNVLDQQNPSAQECAARPDLQLVCQGDYYPPFTVRPGHVFVMGDNRDDSLDGRFSQQIGGVGELPIENLQGRALLSFWSTDGSAEWLLPWTWFTALRWDRLGMTYP